MIDSTPDHHSGRVYSIIAASLLILLILCSCTYLEPEENSVVSTLNQLELGLSFPPVSNLRNRQFTTRQLIRFDIDLVRFSEDWSLRESTPGTYTWYPLDQRMNWVKEEHIQLLLTIQSNGPAWACDPEQHNDRSCVFSDSAHFEKYISALLNRYPNQITKIQFGNEWASEHWFIGSTDDFILYHNILYDAVQRYSPNTEVVLGGFSSGTIEAIAYCNHAVAVLHLQDGQTITQDNADEFCNQPEVLATKERIIQVLKQAKYDWIDLHFYDFVEMWPGEYQAFQDVFLISKPILVSEFGGPNLIYERPYSDDQQAARLSEYIQTLDKMGIPEAYFFKLVQSDDANPAHRESGLYKVKLGLLLKKQAYWVFLDFVQ